jgi:heme/copper-type cytochrome/quinol oxidase subunit 3
MALFAASEATLFGSLIGTYFYLRFKTPSWPPAGIEKPSVAAPLALTGVLLATTVPVFLASAAARAGRARTVVVMFAVAALVQAGYLAAQAHLFASDLDKFGPKQDAYGSIYFTLLGAHHAHVLVGILLELWFVGRALGGLTAYRTSGVRVVALYWYFVNALGVAVVLTQVSPSL